MDREKVLSFIRRKKPLSFREIVYSMGVSRSEARALKKILRQLLREGEIVLTRKGLYGPRQEMNLMRGYFEAHKDGYGFVVLDTPGERDFFIPPHAKAGAMGGDRVIIRVEDPGRREGRIIRILERAHRRVSGTIEIDRKTYFLRPKNKSIPFDIYIPPEGRGGAKKGDSAIVEITEYPKDKRPPAGRVLKIIKRPEDPKAEVEAIIEELGLSTRFPKEVLAEARLLSTKKYEEGRRKDLKALHTVTIDGERAKDFDDAASIKLTEVGYTLWVHIADVGFYVGWDSVIDLEARKRGTSVYFPDRVLPMLPKELSENLSSLIPNEERRTITAEMDFDRYGKRYGARFYPSLIESNERMTYTSVRKIIVDEDKAERKRYDYLLKELELMAELAGLLRQRRLRRGSLDFDLPEPEVLLDVQGRPEKIISAERNFAHMIIEEFMIAANEAVAEALFKSGIPCIYRVHEKPNPMKLDEIMKHVQAITKKRHSDIVGLLSSVKGTPYEESVNYIVLRSLKQARYSTVNIGHFGLASECYLHFTSPIRRYPDLIVHRVLGEFLQKRRLADKRLKELEELLPDMAFNSSRMERLADGAEKDVINALRVWFMKDKVGDEFEGKIIGVTPYGLRVRLKDFYIEGFLHVSAMTEDFYQYSETTYTLRGRHTKKAFGMGQALTVRVDRVDMDEREVIFGT